MCEVIEFVEKNDLKKKLLDKKFSVQFLPECLFQESLSKKVIFKNQNLKTSYLIDFIHNLILKYYFKKQNNFNISSVVLKERYGHLYNYYVDYLIDKNHLHLVKKHNKGKNARIYKLSDHIVKGCVYRYKNSDKILLKKYRNGIIYFDDHKSESSPIESTIKNKLIKDLFSVEIDYTKSLFFLDTSLQHHEIYQKNLYSIESIKDKHIFYHFDNYGRLHTNFTILKSFIRKNCLLIDGEETFELDIKNSQPLFLNKLLNIHKDELDVDELNFYRNLTLQGNFYSFLQNNLNIKDKDKIKSLTYKVLFGKNYSNNQDKSFERLFPSIYCFIKKFKKENGDYRKLSYVLQRYESDFLFNTVIEKIISTDPNIKLITCHDSIICRQSDKSIVSDIFNKLLQNHFII